MSQNFKGLQRNCERKKTEFEDEQKIGKATQFFESTPKIFRRLQVFLWAQLKDWEGYTIFYECRKNIYQHRKNFVSTLKKTGRLN